MKLKTIYKVLITAIVLIAVSTIVMNTIHIEPDNVGSALAGEWCREVELNYTTEQCVSLLNSSEVIIKQGLSLGFFFLVIALTAMRMEWRVAAAILATIILVLLGVTPPQYLIKAVDWDLIVFLIGTLTLAGILRELGVFRYLALLALRASRNNAYLLVALFSLLAYILAATLDEVTSIVYVVMLILEVARIIGVEETPLLILAVLATNTGSSALPIGNPIGVYLYFRTDMDMHTFVRIAFPLSLIEIFVLIGLFILMEWSYLKSLNKALEASRDKIKAYLLVESRLAFEEKELTEKIMLGNFIFIAFVLTVAFNKYIATGLSALTGSYVNPNALLSFIPYLFIALSISKIPMEQIPGFIEKFVEWPSLIFFIFLFILSFMLTYTGAMTRLAYGTSQIVPSGVALMVFMLIASAALSSVLDNLSVIVTFTPVLMMLTKLGIVGYLGYFALLFGGVFGGNYTPIGSTANIVAVGMAEKRNIKITWGKWLKIASITTTIQVILAIIYIVILA